MKRRIALVLIASVLAACGGAKTPTAPSTPGAPKPVASNDALILSLAAILAACEGSAPNVSPVTAQWITAGCPTAVNAVLDAYDANSAADKVQIAVTALQAFLKAAPNATATKDAQIVATVTGAVNGFLLVYQRTQPVAMRVIPTDSVHVGDTFRAGNTSNVIMNVSFADTHAKAIYLDSSTRGWSQFGMFEPKASDKLTWKQRRELKKLRARAKRLHQHKAK